MLNFGNFLNTVTNLYNGFFGENAAQSAAKSLIASQIAREADKILPGLARPTKQIVKDVLSGKTPTGAAVGAAFEVAKPTLINQATAYLKSAISNIFNRIMGPIVSLVVGIFGLFSKMFSTVNDAFNAEPEDEQPEAEPSFLSRIWNKLSNMFAPDEAARPDVEDAFDSDLEDDADYDNDFESDDEADNDFDFEPEVEAPAQNPRRRP